jgi:hypothetical protein
MTQTATGLSGSSAIPMEASSLKLLLYTGTGCLFQVKPGMEPDEKPVPAKTPMILLATV